jgi:hypothetical protein
MFDVAKYVSVMAMGGLLLSACANEWPSDTNPGSSHSADGPKTKKKKKTGGTWRPIEVSEDPNGVVQNASRQLASNISAADVGQTFGVAGDKIPYPDTYWPMKLDNWGANDPGGIDRQWQNDDHNGPNGPDTSSPLEKFHKLFFPGDAQRLARAKAWEFANHGPGVPGVQSWFGHCPGWTGASMFNRPIQHSASLALQGGDLVACNQGDDGCVTFEIGDFDALMAETYNAANSTFVGARCDTAPDRIRFDKDGRVADQQDNGRGCRGVNFGTLIIAAANLMKKGLPFAIDAQTRLNTDQIWNQPAYAYKVLGYKELKEQQAASLVKNCKKGGRCTDSDRTATSYVKEVPTSPDARGWVRVDLDFSWVQENGPNTIVVSGLDSTQHHVLSGIIELDANGNISGGEYLEDRQVGSQRLKNFPFIWTILGPADDLPVNDDPQAGYNPYVTSSLVEQLIQKGF